MHRTLSLFLEEWLYANDRKPLVIRGARQVGKTWIVRDLASRFGKKIIEINFEKNPAYKTFFTSNDPKQILLNLSTLHPETINPNDCLLFLDEIQVVPELLAKLRWFYEELPELPVIAAGSLLEFVLAEHSFSMPVGRISYAHLEPLSFEEFLLAYNKKTLVDYILNYSLSTEIPEVLHEELLGFFKEYSFVGGLPAVVNSWINKRSLNHISQLHQDILSTYRDDFSKYRKHLDMYRLEEVLMGTPRMLGEKFVYSQLNPDVSADTFKKVLYILEKAKVLCKVRQSAANGIPLAAELKEKNFKEILLDIGIANAILGIDLTQITTLNDICVINNGGLAEQVVGQLLRTIEKPFLEPHVYYWRRDEAGSNAEIDYVIQHGTEIVPIEVKAGNTGTLKSLHLFMGLKKLKRAIRINSSLPSKTPVSVKDHAGNSIEYTLISVPFYLTGQIHRLLE